MTATERCRPLIGTASHTTGQVDTSNHTQIPAVGPLPDADHLFVGALLWAHPARTVGVLGLVQTDDLACPHLQTVLEAVREMVSDNRHPSPQLIMDRLTRRGVHRTVLTALIDATTSGAATEAVRDYGAAVVAASLRRRCDTGGLALTEAAESADETDIPAIAATVAEQIAGASLRLTQLRRETT